MKRIVDLVAACYNATLPNKEDSQCTGIISGVGLKVDAYTSSDNKIIA